MKQEEPMSDVVCASKGLPEQEQENCRSKFEHFPGCGRVHVRAGRGESCPAVGTTALRDHPEATVYVPWVQEKMEDMVEKEGAVVQVWDNNENFFGGL